MNMELLNFLIEKNIESIKIEEEDYFINQRLKEKVPAIDKDTARFLYFISFLVRPRYVLEVGYGSGFSSWSIYLGAKDFVKKIISFEHEKKRYNRGLNFVKSKNIPIELINEDFSKQKIQQIMKELNIESFDMIFIDGTKREYPQYFEISYDFLKEKGLILFDNVLFNGNLLKLASMDAGKNVEGAKIMHNFLNKLIESKDLIKYFFSIGDGLLACVKNKIV